MTLADHVIGRLTRQPPDVVIGRGGRAYLMRWFVIPRNRLFNVYLHHFLRSDDDRALHDHPWANCSILLRGTYMEHTIAAGGIHRREQLHAGAWRMRWSGRAAHRIELIDGPCWTLFLTGPRYREWGFHCPEQGWVHSDRFTAAEESGAVGKGCDA